MLFTMSMSSICFQKLQEPAKTFVSPRSSLPETFSPREMSPAAKSKEKWMFLQAKVAAPCRPKNLGKKKSPLFVHILNENAEV